MSEEKSTGTMKTTERGSQRTLDLESKPNSSSISATVESGSWSSVREPLNLLPGATRGPDSRSFTELLAGAMASPAGPNSNSGVETVQIPFLSLSVDAARYVVASPQSVAGRQSHSGFQGNLDISHQEALASVTAQAAQARKQIQLRQCISSLPDSSPTHLHPELKLLPLNSSTTAQNQTSPVLESVSRSTLGPKSKRTLVKKRASGDGYNWRKYGEKQVKGTDCSRSYYRCTDSNCLVKKKVEKNPAGQVTEILYRGHHNHDPPQKVKCAQDGGLLPGGPENAGLSQYLQAHNSSDDETGNEPDPKRRIKTVPKVIVQTVSDLGSQGDGYRWRKYGQKLVKGNPNPRSYYRCTCRGCPVRKHVERASDDPKALVVTYEGKHNHERPDLKNYDSSATALLLAAAAVTGGGYKDVPSDISLDRKLGSSWSSGKGSDTGRKASDFGGDRALESAQTLLSIGLSTSKSSEDDIGENNSKIIQQPLLSKNHAAVSV